MANNDFVNIFAEDDLDIPNLEGLDPNSIQAMMDEENAKVKELELQCAKLKQQEDLQKRRAVLESLEALQAVKTRKAMLKRALAGEIPMSSVMGGHSASNPVTPVSSPVKTRRVAATPGPAASQNLGELPNLLTSVLQMRQGNAAPFASLMSNRANLSTSALPDFNSCISNNLLANPNSGGGSKVHFLDDQTNRIPQGNISEAQNSNSNLNSNDLLHLIKNLNSQPNGPPIVDSGATSASSLSKVKDGVVNSNNGVSNLESDKSSVTIAKHSSASPTDSDDDKPKKPKKSGIMTKPDESDILQTVKYPHELLDDRHVKGNDKIFTKLTFSNFCAGELELIKRSGISQEEKDARISVLTTLCYHHSYLDITEIRAQYDATMKRVERGVASWKTLIESDRLHNDLAFRASVLVREKVSDSKSDKSKSSSGQNAAAAPYNPAKKLDSSKASEAKVHFCADYNKGACIFEDHHPGKLNGKDTYLYHICKRCLFAEGKHRRSHPESDINCPSKI